ncbi:MAG: FAD-dependent oxidoreductase [Bacillota bacterium]|nr:FAD-dependent oxidoreductase [Bacillota bacterium]
MSFSEKAPQFPKTYWREIELPSFNKLDRDLNVDVAIVGAGITGITAAYLLSKQGFKVAILEAGSVLNGTTGHTTAKITAQHGLLYDEFIQHLGEEKAKLYYESHIRAMEFIKKTGINCDLSEEDAYVYATTDEYADKIKTEWEAYQKLGIPGDFVNSITFDIPIKAALSMHGQAQYHPLKFLKGLLEDAIQSGCTIYENTTANDMEEEESEEPTIITNDGFRVKCKFVIVASHYPFCNIPGFYFARMYAERSYAIGIKTDKEYPGGMYISVDDPIRSIRYTPTEDGNLIIIGGEKHKTGQGPDTLSHYEALAKFAEDIFGIKEYSYRWSAQDLVTLDKLPFIGPFTENKHHVLVATGYKKWGMTTGILAGHLLTDYVLNRDNPYMELYSPARFHADPELRKLITANADVAGHLLKGKLEFVPKDTGDLGNGEGCVVMHNGKRAGAYKDENGKLYIVDTTCTHFGCELEWNHGEKTWDCPCHGSRFSYEGDVVEGPALKPLENLSKE